MTTWEDTRPTPCRVNVPICLADTPWGDDGVDDSGYDDVCHHGMGFDEECEACDDEDGMLCADGHDYDVLDGRCHECGAHAP